MLVFSEGGHLLILQAIAGLTSTVGGIALGGGTPTVAPRSFLDRYSEVPAFSRSDSSFSTVLPSHVTPVLPVQGGGTPAPAPVRHGGPLSHPNPVSVDAVPSARPAASFSFGGMASTAANARGMSVLPRLHVGGAPAMIMGGSSVTVPPNNVGYYPHGHGGPPAHHEGHPSAQLSPSMHGWHHATPRDVPSVVYGGASYSHGHGGCPRAATSVAPSLAFVGSSHHPSLP